jgi:hypothetical protein
MFSVFDPQIARSNIGIVFNFDSGDFCDINLVDTYAHWKDYAAITLKYILISGTMYTLYLCIHTNGNCGDLTCNVNYRAFNHSFMTQVDVDSESNNLFLNLTQQSQDAAAQQKADLFFTIYQETRQTNFKGFILTGTLQTLASRKIIGFLNAYTQTY